MKYIPIEDEHLYDFVDILLPMILSLRPGLEEDEARETIIQFFQENSLTALNANILGEILYEMSEDEIPIGYIDEDDGTPSGNRGGRGPSFN